MVSQEVDVLRELFNVLHPIGGLAECPEAEDIGGEKHKDSQGKGVVLLTHLYVAIEHMLVARVILLNRLDALCSYTLCLLYLVSGALYSVSGLNVRVAFVSAALVFLLLLGKEFRFDILVLIKQSQLLA